LAKVLIAGESWSTTSIHAKGFDVFTTVSYEEGVDALRDALLAAEHEVTFMPNHIAAVEFPHTAAELQSWDVVLLSDIGSNTLLIPPAAFAKFESKPNRLAALRDWTRAGGGFGMIGGYLSFQGIEAKANYRTTPVAEVLPVELEVGDDRIETPEDAEPRVVGTHPVVEGMPERWPTLLGYQRVAPRGDVLATVNSEPLLVVGAFGEGRALAYTSDIGPHWAPPEFLAWDGYARLWDQAVRWLSG
jgi:uncharacterized membrane protein